VNTDVQRQTRPRTLLYRERGSDTWNEVSGANALQYHLSENDGLRLSFTCERFSSLALGQLVGELLILEGHDFSTDIAFAPSVAFEYRPDSSTGGTRVFARIHPCATPDLELPFKATATFARGVVRYTTKLGAEAAFVASVTQQSLHLGSARIRRFDPAPSSHANPTMTLGRPTAPASNPASNTAPAPSAAKPDPWFRRWFSMPKTRPGSSRVATNRKETLR
jgi:hypothetical protein